MTGESDTQKHKKNEMMNTATSTSGSEEGKSQSAEKAGKTTIVSNSPTKQKRSLWQSFFLLLLFFLLIGLFIAGYFAWRQQQQHLILLGEQTASQKTQIDLFRETLQQNERQQLEELSQVRQQQESIQARLDSHHQRLRSLAGTSRDDWLLAEARYLLRLASQRLLVERGTEGAQALLVSADGILQSLSDRDIQTVRDAIASDLIALKLAKKVDREGIYARLNALKLKIQSLSIAPARIDPTTVAKTSSQTLESDPDKTWYQKIWDSIRGAFSGFLTAHVQVSSLDQQPQLLIAKQQRLQLINGLQLMLEQAQFAMLHEEEMIYKNSLQQASNWWRKHFLPYAEYEVIQIELQALQELPIVQEIPRIQRSARLLTDYIDRFHRLNPPVPPAKASSEGTAPEEGSSK